MAESLGAHKELIGRNIRTIRESVGETQQELADAIHVTKQAVSNYERGTSMPDTDMLSSIAGHYEVTLQILTDSAVPDLKSAFQAEHLADDFSEYRSSLFPLFESEELLLDPDFSKAYRFCESMISAGIVETETAVEAINTLYDLHEEKGSAEALADALFIWFNIVPAVRAGKPSSELVEFFGSDSFMEGKASIAIKDMTRGLQKPDLDADVLKGFCEFTVDLISALKGHRGFEDLAYYYLALGYLCGIIDDDLDLPESQQIAFSMLFSMGSIGNRYARNAIAGIWALHHKPPEVKDA